MSTEIFERTFGQSVAPVLFHLGFREVRPPHGWMVPAMLFEFENRWFGASWDHRDQYLETTLGRLFRFRDVFPRVIVRGHYRHDASCTGENVQDFLAAHLAQVGRDVPLALDRFDQRLAAALDAAATPPEHATRKGRRVFAEYATRIGDPIALDEWKGSQVIPRDGP